MYIIIHQALKRAISYKRARVDLTSKGSILCDFLHADTFNFIMNCAWLRECFNNPLWFSASWKSSFCRALTLLHDCVTPLVTFYHCSPTVQCYRTEQPHCIILNYIYASPVYYLFCINMNKLQPSVYSVLPSFQGNR